MINKLVPRGLRNKNPGNIRHSRSEWLGKAATQTDDSFVQFTSMAHGIRAIYKTLRSYQRVHGLSSVEEIIRRWAPPSENDTQAYIRSVEKGMINPFNVWENQADIDALVRGIIRHENGIMVLSVIKNSDMTLGRV